MAGPWEKYQTQAESVTSGPWDKYQQGESLPEEQPKSTGQRIAAAVSPYARPLLEYGGMMAGGTVGGASGLLTGPGAVAASPIGALAGGGLGYAGGRQAADRLDEYAGIRKPQSLPQQMLQAGKDVASGAAMEGTGQVTGKALEPVGKWLAKKAPYWYESALKIPPSIPKDVRDKAVKTGIEGRYSPTEKGLKRAQTDLETVNTRIADEVKNMPQTTTVPIPGKTAATVIPTAEKYHQGGGYVVRLDKNRLMESRGAPNIFRTEEEAKAVADRLASAMPKPGPATKEVGTIKMDEVVTRVDDLKEFYNRLPKRVAEEFTKPLDRIKSRFASAGQITPAEAQEMKRTLYALNRKHYGDLKSSVIEGNKAVARGLKEELVKQNPALGYLNAKDSALINLEQVLERAVNRTRNYDVVRLGDMVSTAAGGAAGGPAGAATAGFLKRIVEAPNVKAHVAFALKKAEQAQKFPLTSRFVGYEAWGE